ncbi:hypothetical protein DL98DRAFT_569680 [Cadophora sp. DSE1049]|nr:hypothetical protein DL98DRAFT_569680 [Cadophora sp. DSE1049]
MTRGLTQPTHASSSQMSNVFVGPARRRSPAVVEIWYRHFFRRFWPTESITTEADASFGVKCIRCGCTARQSSLRKALPVANEFSSEKIPLGPSLPIHLDNRRLHSCHMSYLQSYGCRNISSVKEILCQYAGAQLRSLDSGLVTSRLSGPSAPPGCGSVWSKLNASAGRGHQLRLAAVYLFKTAGSHRPLQDSLFPSAAAFSIANKHRQKAGDNLRFKLCGLDQQIRSSAIPALEPQSPLPELRADVVSLGLPLCCAKFRARGIGATRFETCSWNYVKAVRRWKSMLRLSASNQFQLSEVTLLVRKVWHQLWLADSLHSPLLQNSHRVNAGSYYVGSTRPLHVAVLVVSAIISFALSKSGAASQSTSYPESDTVYLPPQLRQRS